MFSLFDGVANLASTIIEIWLIKEKSRQGQLERDHQYQLQRAQHEHELLLHKLRTGQIRDDSNSQYLDDSFLERLRQEAITLSSMGYDVIYEPMTEGYSVALPFRGDSTLAFWLLPSYPNEPPQVFIKTPEDLEKIEFAPGAWKTNLSIADIVRALTIDS